MPSSGILRRVVLVRTDDSKERSASIISVTRIGELGITHAAKKDYVYYVYYRIFRSARRLLVTLNVVPISRFLVPLMMEALPSCKTSVLTGSTRRNIPEDGILQSHRRETLKSYPICFL
jgi:hypothetical protein